VVEVTRLLSNLIKSPFINFQGKDTYVVSYEEENKKEFVSLEESKKVLLKPLDQYMAEQKKEDSPVESPLLREEEAIDQAREEEFETGYPVANFDQLFEENKKRAEEEADLILNEAQARANEILNEAQVQADRVSQNAYEEGLRQGREEGIAKGQKELEELRQELEEQKEKLQAQYDELSYNLEPRYADILCKLLQKLTGILVTDQKAVLTYLIHRSISESEPSKHYILRVSTDDVVYVESHRDEILLKAGVDAIITVQEEKGLRPGDCIIETDSQMLNCSFETQLGNAINTIRILAQSD